ncbi:Uncharacterized protein FWK35_00016247 [Aphis craccivora]|uniref:Uncharacterized protein n=1 Tax=Aphis craccivora TaxID=307492 RepID=A0A6G0YFX8_APHCR|nr:Uncharacterized protein FWK35_00016247 [Aphis craccivora]
MLRIQFEIFNSNIKKYVHMYCDSAVLTFFELTNSVNFITIFIVVGALLKGKTISAMPYALILTAIGYVFDIFSVFFRTTDLILSADSSNCGYIKFFYCIMQFFSKYTQYTYKYIRNNCFFFFINKNIINCHMPAVDPYDVIYCETNWVVGDLTYTTYMKRLESPDTKFNIILNLFYFYMVYMCIFHTALIYMLLYILMLYCYWLHSMTVAQKKQIRLQLGLYDVDKR